MTYAGYLFVLLIGYFKELQAFFYTMYNTIKM